MKNLTKTASDTARVTSTETGIERTMQAYEVALNASDIDAVVDLFTPDGVFMAPNNPSAVGAGTIRAAYLNIFKSITLETELNIEEIVQVAPNWAFVRTHSAGFVTVHAIGQRVPDANHELFIFYKGDDGSWKIARYSFSTTNPLPQ